MSSVAGGGDDPEPVSALADTSDATSASPAADSSAPAKTPAPSKAAAPKATPKPKPKPSVQARFVDAVENGIKAGDSDNEIKVVQARKKRGAAMCSILPSSLQVASWKGTVKEVHFSGSFVRESSSCLSEQSLIDANGMLTPTFTFKFSSFKKD